MDNTSPPKTAHYYAPLLAQGHWFNELAPTLQQWLLNKAIVRKLVSGERLFARGDAFCGLYAVVDGKIRVSGLSHTMDNSKEALLTLLEAPDWFGEIALFDHKVRTHDAFAEGATVVLQIKHQALSKLLTEQPQYWRDFGLLMTHKLRLSFVCIEQQALLPAPVRLAYRLLSIAEWHGGRYHKGMERRSVDISQEQLASLLSLSRQTTNQILKNLEQQQIILLHRNSIEIVNMDALRAVIPLPSSAAK